MIIKFDSNYLCDHLTFSSNGYHIGSWGFSNKRIPDTIKLTLSLKLGKKRVLISGQLDFEFEFDGKMDYKVYYFIPNNPEKLKQFFLRKKNYVGKH